MCVGGSTRHDGGWDFESKGSRADDPSAEFIIENQHPGPVIVSATSGALRIRLATVTSWRDRRVSVPPLLVGRGRVVRLVARPVGSRDEVATEVFAVDPGDRVYWTLMSRVESSPATLRVQMGGR